MNAILNAVIVMMVGLAARIVYEFQKEETQ